jgi:hypothetical protein
MIVASIPSPLHAKKAKAKTESCVDAQQRLTVLVEIGKRTAAPVRRPIASTDSRCILVYQPSSFPAQRSVRMDRGERGYPRFKVAGPGPGAKKKTEKKRKQ